MIFLRLWVLLYSSYLAYLAFAMFIWGGYIVAKLDTPAKKLANQIEGGFLIVIVLCMLFLIISTFFAKRFHPLHLLAGALPLAFPFTLMNSLGPLAIFERPFLDIGLSIISVAAMICQNKDQSQRGLTNGSMLAWAVALFRK